MKKKVGGLTIAKNLTLPIDLCTDTIGILAVKGSGKSYTFMVAAEEMIDSGVPVVIIDVVGVCYGLRTSASGKKDGLPIVVLGGEHGDLPLDPSTGRMLAEFAANDRRSMVLDVSGFSTKADQIRFVTAFVSRLYEVNREPLHVMIDEADEFCPQKPFGEETRMVRAFEILVRRGRARGIGVTMVTQRPAVLNKNVLTMCGTLIVGRVVSPQDRKAIGDWVDAHGTADQKKTLWESLAALPTADKWVWSPLRDIFKRVTIRERRTFDSSATPKFGKVRIEPKKLAPVDLEALRTKMASTIEEAKRNDPKELQARLRAMTDALLKKDTELAKVLATKSDKATRVEKTKLVKRDVPVITAKQMKQFEKFGAAMEKIAGPFMQYVEKLAELVVETNGNMKLLQKKVADGQLKWDTAPVSPAISPTFKQINAYTRPTGIGHAVAAVPIKNGASPKKIYEDARAIDNGIKSVKIGKCERAVLAVIAQRTPKPTSMSQAAILSGYTVTSGGFRNALGNLRAADLIQGGNDTPMYATELGFKMADPAKLPTGQELAKYWYSKLGKCERIVLQVLVEAQGKSVPKSEIAARSGELTGNGIPYSETSGGFRNAMGELRTLELAAGYDEMVCSPDFLESVDSTRIASGQ